MAAVLPGLPGFVDEVDAADHTLVAGEIIRAGRRVCGDVLVDCQGLHLAIRKRYTDIEDVDRRVGDLEAQGPEPANIIPEHDAVMVGHVVDIAAAEHPPATAVTPADVAALSVL